MRILYVEDNPANLSLMLRIARMGNHEIVSYVQGEEALANYDRDQPDIVLLDLQLAGQLGGMDVMQTLRSRGVKTPMVAVTAYAMVGDKERCLAAGFTDYMAKPLQVAELVEKLQRYEAQLAAQAVIPPQPTPASTRASVSAVASATSSTTTTTETALPPVPTASPTSTSPDRSTGERAAVPNVSPAPPGDTPATLKPAQPTVTPLGGTALSQMRLL